MCSYLNKSIIVWDCSHAIGVIDIDVKASKTKTAIGCTYKFLNGGPGSPSFLYVSKDLLNHMQNPIKGWFGHSKPFNFENKYKPADNINKKRVNAFIYTLKVINCSKATQINAYGSYTITLTGHPFFILR